MPPSLDPDTWVYVVVQNDTIVGQHESTKDIDFIPFFEDRETAVKGVVRLTTVPGKPPEAQAILFEDLTRYAEKEGFLLFLINGSGQIESKFGPNGRPL
ncbi:MAG: hypothetical protein HKP58_01715 [Desulfatitalea sp.]|nr:hypothetical protein [Desulfatitalea sp.]NNJ99104.1 hypothetical protein [Desulfatitalea sp.]